MPQCHSENIHDEIAENPRHCKEIIHDDNKIPLIDFDHRI